MAAPSHILRAHPGECALGECVPASSVPSWNRSARTWRYEIRIDESTIAESRSYAVAVRIFAAGTRYDEHGERSPIWIREF